MVSIIVSKISCRKVIGASDKLLCLILKFLFFISSAKTAISIYWIHLNCREMCSFIFEKLSPSVFFIALILFLSLIGHFLMIHSAKIILIKNCCDACACFSMLNYLNLYVSIFYENRK